MSDSAWRRSARPSLEQLRKRAKELLRQYRAGEETARSRFAAAGPRPPGASRARSASLADAQFVLAREHGFESWTRLKNHFEEGWPARLSVYERLAEDLVHVCQAADGGALERLRELFGGTFTGEQLRGHVAQRLGAAAGGAHGGGSVSREHARLFVAKLYGFESWADFERAVAQPPAGRGAAAHGFSTTPFYKIDWDENWIEPRPPVSSREWDEIFTVMRENRISGLRAAGQMTDAALERLAQLDLVRSLDLDGCRRITDAGLRHLASMPRLERLNLSGCNITDPGLSVLGRLPELREFSLCHHNGVSDAGLASLASCERIERVDLLGSRAGDGVLRALTGKPKLRHFKSGNQVTDAGLPLLHQFPVFQRWQGGEAAFSLMKFDAEPNYLLLRGQISDEGLASLAGLEGLFALNLHGGGTGITAAGLKPLAVLPHLGWLGLDATDETMRPIAALPSLRMLMCQDTRAGDAGFTALTRSRTLEFIWGRRCYNLTGRGFAALAQMPSLRGLSVSCKNVDDAALSALPHFPALIEFMPMDVRDEGFRHVGRCERLQALWCMYCRDTGDAATEQIAGLRGLRSYYAGQTRITDRSLEILSRMQVLERLTFWACAGVTDLGVAALAALPHLREVSIEAMPNVSHGVAARFPAGVRVRFGT